MSASSLGQALGAAVILGIAALALLFAAGAGSSGEIGMAALMALLAFAVGYLGWRQLRPVLAERATGAHFKGPPLAKYFVSYRGGLPGHTSSHADDIGFYVTTDCFILQPTAASKRWFDGLTIPYANVLSFDIVERQVSTVEGILGGLDSHQLNQANNIHIGMEMQGQRLVLRLEMQSGISVMAQAAKCRELVDVLRVHGIFERVSGGSPDLGRENAPDPVALITRLSQLHDQGVLSTEEFEAKKTDLLSRL
jgi:hypothetical protein